MKEIRQIIQLCEEHKDKKVQMALATVVNIEESSYRRIGARMLILENGEWVGGISGGCLEGDVLKQAKKVMASKMPRSVVYDTREGDPYQIGIGLGCEGRIEILLQPLDVNGPIIQNLRRVSTARESHLVLTIIRSSASHPLFGKSFLADSPDLPEQFKSPLTELRREKRSTSRTIETKHGDVEVLFEWIEPNIRLILAGHNYDIYPLISFAEELGWDVELICNRRNLKNISLKELIIHPFENIGNIKVDPRTAIISMTHDYEKDKAMLSYFHNKTFGYFGMLGPRKRFERMSEELALSEEVRQNIHNPVGLDIGSRTPEEIGLSAVSEIISHFRKGTGLSLRKKINPIHLRN